MGGLVSAQSSAQWIVHEALWAESGGLLEDTEDLAGISFLQVAQA